MKKLDTKTLNQANADIWSKLFIAYQQKNWASIEKNLKRLHALQSYYLSRINLAEQEIRELNLMIKAYQSEVNQYESQWMQEVSKRNGTFDRVNDRLDELFGS